jgi:hypothetical protein
MNDQTPPPPTTFDAYMLGNIHMQSQLFPRRSVQTAFRRALILAEERGHTIPDHYRPKRTSPTVGA